MLGSLPTDVLNAIIHLATASPFDSPPGSASDRPASQIVPYLLVSRRTYPEVLKRLYRNVHVESTPSVLECLATTLRSSPSKGRLVQSFKLIQTVTNDRREPTYIPLSRRDVDNVRTVLQACAPVEIMLHLFETIPRLLEAVDVDRVELLELCIRSDATYLPTCHGDAWLGVLQRVKSPLKLLHIGGRLISAECRYDFDILAKCPRLLHLSEASQCNHSLHEDTSPMSKLYIDLIRMNESWLKHVDLIPLQYEGMINMEKLVRHDMPELKELEFGIGDSLEFLQAELAGIGKFKTVEILRFTLIEYGTLEDALPIITRTLLDWEWLPSLKLLDCTAATLGTRDPTVKRRVEDLLSICQRRGLRLLWNASDE